MSIAKLNQISHAKAVSPVAKKPTAVLYIFYIALSLFSVPPKAEYHYRYPAQAVKKVLF